MRTRELQERLKSLGFDVDVDGVYGPQTEEAIFAALDDMYVPTVPSPAWPAISTQPTASRYIDEIIIHCTATPEGRDVSVDTIRGWHKDRGWRDIGYHWVVLLDGSIEPGRPEAQVGSHVQGHNDGTLGVVYVGGVASDGKTPKDTRTDAQKDALMRIVQEMIAKYPVKKVTGHNDHTNAKACPSFKVGKDPLGSLV